MVEKVEKEARVEREVKLARLRVVKGKVAKGKVARVEKEARNAEDFPKVAGRFPSIVIQIHWIHRH